MQKYFDKTFFKFLGGFFLILLSSFLVLLAVGYYQVEIKGVPSHASVDSGDSK